MIICLFATLQIYCTDTSVMWQPLKREAGKTSSTTPHLSLPVVPHVGETDTDTLTEIPDRQAQVEDEDEFGYSWSEFDSMNRSRDSYPPLNPNRPIRATSSFFMKGHSLDRSWLTNYVIWVLILLLWIIIQ